MFNEITLEISLKPFKKTDDDYVISVCRKLFGQWRDMTRGAKKVSVLFWTADGSEILDYDGDLKKSFEWCKYLGNANMPDYTQEDHKAISIHNRRRLYIPDPPVFTYGILKRIVAIMRKTAGEYCPGAVISIGETFDIGPEFAVSDFKYRRHRELLSGSGADGIGFVDSSAKLCADSRRYAAFPDGIPEGTDFGLFLGKQTKVFLEDMGFDYLWLSNGVGFSADPWISDGKIYDGKEFHPERLERISESVMSFWKSFREGCPDHPVETRGTNNSAGIDYAADGVPLYRLYNSGFGLTPPPNSPWAAINGDLGLELMGHMTRICELPGNGFPFRFYLHDPWWANSPWFDRYDRCPYDVYLPMAISRIDENGKTRTADHFEVLTADNSFGEMPDFCPSETIPHFIRAAKFAPDAPGPFVWVYPLKEFTQAKDGTLLREMYEGDNFIKAGVNGGFPLNCVISSTNFVKTDKSVFSGCVLISPVQPDPEVRAELEAFCKSGGKLVTYAAPGASDVPEGGVRIDTGSGSLGAAVGSFGYVIGAEKPSPGSKSPVMTLHRKDNGFVFSVYTPDTTVASVLSTPLGAPIPDCADALMQGDKAVIRFPRWFHRECRVFVKQKDGVVSVRESAPVSAYYKRMIQINGLKDAEVRIFPESACAGRCDITDHLRHPADGIYNYLEGWESVGDEYGKYYMKKNVSGSVRLCMPFDAADGQ